MQQVTNVKTNGMFFFSKVFFLLKRQITCTKHLLAVVNVCTVLNALSFSKYFLDIRVNVQVQYTGL